MANTAGRLKEALPDVAASILEQVATEQQNTLTTFVSLLVKEEQTQARENERKSTGDITITGTQCTP